MSYTGQSESVQQCNGANTSPPAVEQDLSSSTTRMGIFIQSFSGSVADCVHCFKPTAIPEQSRSGEESSLPVPPSSTTGEGMFL